MESNSMVFDYSHITTNLLVKNENIPSTSQVLDSLWLPNPSPFHGFDTENNSDIIPFGTEKDTKMENSNEDCDENFQQPEKKRRLLPEQVKFLEKSFEVENKLDPERKIKLAKQLGLEPRQVTIWFQNRRARYRTKLLEKEFNSLKGSFDKLKQDCDSLSNDNEKLKIEVQVMREKLLGKENGMPKTEPFSPILDVEQKNQISESNVVALVTCCNQEGAASSAKSDVLDSPHYKTDVALLDVSDFSQDENGGTFLPKLEIDDDDDLQPNSCSFGFPVQEQGTWFWLWQY